LQIERLARLGRACRKARRELLIELQAFEADQLGEGDLPRLVEHLYSCDIRPEWWKLPALASAEAWSSVDAIIEREDSSCRGVLVLGSTTRAETLTSLFPLLAQFSCIRGFAIGRAIFAAPAERWLRDEISDEDLVAGVAAGYLSTIEAWTAAEDRKRLARAR
jgi:5-dehydro-2-deoxygluconokinase